MQRKEVKVIIGISIVAILVLVVLQVRWTINAFYLSEKQFGHRVSLALNEAVEDLSRSTEFYRGCTNVECEYFNEHLSTFEQAINKQMLGKVLEEKFTNYGLHERYNYTLHHTSQTDHPPAVVFSNSVYLRPHDDCESWEPSEYQLGVYFPDKTQYIIHDMLGSIFVSSLLLLFVVFAMYYTVNSLLRHKKLSEIKNDFINNMTHEFKTPLATISLAAEVLQRADPVVSGQRIQKYSTIIREENQRLRTQVDHILKAAMLQKKEIDLDLKTLDVHKLLRDTVGNLCLDQYNKNIQVHFNLDAHNQMVWADALHLSNMLINLLNNAVKYSGQHDVSIWVTTKNIGQNICIQVKDNGIGIPREHQRNIFDKFYRVSSGDIHNVKGFGLGLFYVKEMARAHGGDISVESDPGQGSVFSLSLPASQTQSS